MCGDCKQIGSAFEIMRLKIIQNQYISICLLQKEEKTNKIVNFLRRAIISHDSELQQTKK